MSDEPMVSVIVPCYNEEKCIKETVGALIQQNYLGSIEIIVVDDGSTDKTSSIIKEYKKKNTIPSNRSIKILKKENGGKPSALNYGIEHANGVYCICTDGDTVLDKEVVRLTVNRFQEEKYIGVVAGFVYVKNNHTLFTKFQEIEYIFGQLQYRFLQGSTGSVLIAPGAITGLRTDLANIYPSSEETCVEDFDTTISIKLDGWKTVLEPKAKAYTQAPETLSSWWNQRKRWWYGIFQVWKKYKSRLKTFPWFLFAYPYQYIIGLIITIILFAFPVYLLLSPSIGLAMRYFMTYMLLTMTVMFSRIAFFCMEVGKMKYLPILPAFVLYDFLCSWCSFYLYARYLLGIGVSFKYGRKWVYAK